MNLILLNLNTQKEFYKSNISGIQTHYALELQELLPIIL